MNQRSNTRNQRPKKIELYKYIKPKLWYQNILKKLRLYYVYVKLFEISYKTVKTVLRKKLKELKPRPKTDLISKLTKKEVIFLLNKC